MREEKKKGKKERREQRAWYLKGGSWREPTGRVGPSGVFSVESECQQFVCSLGAAVRLSIAVGDGQRAGGLEGRGEAIGPLCWRRQQLA